MLLSTLERVCTDQMHLLQNTNTGTARYILTQLPDIQTHALVVSGIRRCGKSTLLNQFVKKQRIPYFYLNFDDLRLLDFSVHSYALLDEVIKKSKSKLLFFDEIQSASRWELYVRQKLDEGYKVILTGSNASLLGRELGTKLTGRHLVKELYPFSYPEFLRFSNRKKGKKSLKSYLESGGFPEYLKLGDPFILTQLQKDILYRDISVRYNIKDERSLQSLYVFLASNPGALVSPSKLKHVAGVKSHTTVLEYFSYFENSYLIDMVPKFAWSRKAQSLAPKKVYLSDIGLIRTGGVMFSKNSGHILENFVFNHLRREYGSFGETRIFYFNDGQNECDFIVNPDGKTMCIQVCTELNLDNIEREVNGLISAMDFFGTSEAFILTENSSDTIIHNGKNIKVLPVWEYFAGRSI